MKVQLEQRQERDRDSTSGDRSLASNNRDSASVDEPRQCKYPVSACYPACFWKCFACTSRILYVLSAFGRDQSTIISRGVPLTTHVYMYSMRLFYYFRTTLAHPPGRNPDQGSHSGPFPPLPTTVRAFTFITTIM